MLDRAMKMKTRWFTATIKPDRVEYYLVPERFEAAIEFVYGLVDAKFNPPLGPTLCFHDHYYHRVESPQEPEHFWEREQ